MIPDQVHACDVEPIHIPGAIQPHGVLVAVDPRSFAITQISANSAEFFGTQPQALLGRSLTTLMGAAAGAVSSVGSASSPPAGESIVVDIGGREVDVLTHRHQGIQIVELEHHDPEAPSPDAALRAAQKAAAAEQHG